MLDLKALLAKILNCLTCDLLYDGSFTSGTLTLTNTIANYKSLIFVYTDNDGVLHTQQVIINNASNRNFILDVTRVTGVAYLKNMIININGSVLTSNTNRQWAGNTPTTGNYVILNKVYGCKGVVSNGGGGYLTSKFYEIFSHLERWWEYVRFKGVIKQNIESNLQPVGLGLLFRRFKNITCKPDIDKGERKRLECDSKWIQTSFRKLSFCGQLSNGLLYSKHSIHNTRGKFIDVSNCESCKRASDSYTTISNFVRQNLNLDRGCLAC